LSIHSAEVAFIDLGEAPVLAEPLRRELDPSTMSEGRFRVVENAVLCSTGGDGAFPFEIRGDAAGCTEIQVLCDDPGIVPDVWRPAGIVHARSGVLLVADPYLVREHTVEDYDGPVFLGGLWIEMHLPGAGDVAIDLGVREGASIWESPLVVRARWLG